MVLPASPDAAVSGYVAVSQAEDPMAMELMTGRRRSHRSNDGRY